MVHEWALAESIVLYVKNNNVKEARRLIVKIGALQSIDKEILEFALRELIKSYGLKIDNVEIIEEPPSMRCNNCGYQWSIDPSGLRDDIRESIHFLPEAVYAYIKCPRCGSIDYEIVSGRGLREVVIESHDQ